MLIGSDSHLKPVFPIANSEMGSKLEISPYLFNHDYGFQQPYDTRPYSKSVKGVGSRLYMSGLSDTADPAFQLHDFWDELTLEIPHPQYPRKWVSLGIVLHIKQAHSSNSYQQVSEYNPCGH